MTLDSICNSWDVYLPCSRSSLWQFACGDVLEKQDIKCPRAEFQIYATSPYDIDELDHSCLWLKSIVKPICLVLKIATCGNLFRCAFPIEGLFRPPLTSCLLLSCICAASSPHLWTLQIFSDLTSDMWDLTSKYVPLFKETKNQLKWDKKSTNDHGEVTVAWLLQEFCVFKVAFGLGGFDNPDSSARLCSFSASSRGGRFTGACPRDEPAWEDTCDDSHVPQTQRWIPHGGGDNFQVRKDILEHLRLFVHPLLPARQLICILTLLGFLWCWTDQLTIWPVEPGQLKILLWILTLKKTFQQQRSRLLLQAETLLKTLVLFSSRPITLHIAHNNPTIINQMEEAASKFGKGDWLRFCAKYQKRFWDSWKIRLASVPIEYPPGLEDMINGWKICATARLFLQVPPFCQTL